MEKAFKINEFANSDEMKAEFEKRIYKAVRYSDNGSVESDQRIRQICAEYFKAVCDFADIIGDNYSPVEANYFVKDSLHEIAEVMSHFCEWSRRRGK